MSVAARIAWAQLLVLGGKYTETIPPTPTLPTECGIVPQVERSTVPRFQKRAIVAMIQRGTVPKFRRARR